MKVALIAGGVLFLAIGTGCDRHTHARGHQHGHGEGKGGHGHGDDAQSFSGATYEAGRGITLLPETKALLRIETAELLEKPLLQKVIFPVRVYSTMAGERQSLASGFVSPERAALLHPGLPLSFGPDGTGAIERVSEASPGGEPEVLCTLKDAQGETPVGAFVDVTVQVQASAAPVAVVPKDAVIRGMESNFVYVVNGDAFLRTCVTTGRHDEEYIEIKEGLVPGDEVVRRGAMDLWLVELRAVKGGQGCCPAPPRKKT